MTAISPFCIPKSAFHIGMIVDFEEELATAKN